MGELVRHRGDAYGLRELVRDDPLSPLPLNSAPVGLKFDSSSSLPNGSGKGKDPSTTAPSSGTTGDRGRELRSTPSAAVLRSLHGDIDSDDDHDNDTVELHHERAILKAKKVAFERRRRALAHAQMTNLKAGILHSKPPPPPSSLSTTIRTYTEPSLITSLYGNNDGTKGGLDSGPASPQLM
jgi:hypothetical protein